MVFFIVANVIMKLNDIRRFGDSKDTLTTGTQGTPDSSGCPIILSYANNPMTATTAPNKEFSDFCAQRDAQNTIQLNVIKHTWELCEALRQNYIDYSIKSHQRSLERGESVDYHNACITDLKNGKCDYDFTFESGKKYHKIIMNAAGQRSVHAFIDKKTGSVYKAASWRGPAKGERCNLLIIKERERALENADWAGNWLYLR